VFGRTLLSPFLQDAVDLTRSTVDTAIENSGLRVAEEGERSHMYSVLVSVRSADVSKWAGRAVVGELMRKGMCTGSATYTGLSEVRHCRRL
jgi:hypothetical protein